MKIKSIVFILLISVIKTGAANAQSSAVVAGAITGLWAIESVIASSTNEAISDDQTDSTSPEGQKSDSSWSKSNKILVKQVNDDAVLFVANQGINPTALLDAFLNRAREKLIATLPSEQKNIESGHYDVVLAKEIIREAAKLSTR